MRQFLSFSLLSREFGRRRPVSSDCVRHQEVCTSGGGFLRSEIARDFRSPSLTARSPQPSFGPGVSKRRRPFCSGTIGRPGVRAEPSEGWPPIHMSFFLDAAILSRIRSPVTSRSNWAKESSTLSVRRPMLLVVLNACVTDTNDTPCASKTSTILAKSASVALHLNVRRRIQCFQVLLFAVKLRLCS